MKKTFPLATLLFGCSLLSNAAVDPSTADHFRYRVSVMSGGTITYTEATTDGVYAGDTLELAGVNTAMCTITPEEVVTGTTYWKASFSFSVDDDVEYTLSNIHLTFNPSLAKADAESFSARYLVKVYNGDTLVNSVVGYKTYTIDKSSASYAITLDESGSGGANYNGSYTWERMQDSMTGNFRMDVYFENVADVSSYTMENFALVGWSKDIAVEPTPSTPAVPEPTTATLSLLALAGLAARRRCRA